MLSFAKRPHAVTQAWILRLQAGVSKDELLEFFGLAGLPLTEASRILSAETTKGTPVDNDWSDRSAGYKRAVLGVLLVSVVGAVATSIAAGEGPFGILAIATALVLAGVVLHKVIVRLSGGMG